MLQKANGEEVMLSKPSFNKGNTHTLTADLYRGRLLF
jgi:hypothetical protein